MYLNKLFERSTGRTLLLFQETKRVKGKNRTRTVERIGYLDELEKIYDDPIAHFKEEAKRRSVRQKLNVEVSLDEHHQFDAESREVKAPGLSLGMLPLSQIYHELEIGSFWDNRRRYTKARYNHNAIFQALVFGKILFPESQLSTWRNRLGLLSNMDFTDEDVRHALPFFEAHKTALQKHLHRKVGTLYGRDPSVLYRARVPNGRAGEEHHIQMGLLTDDNGLPIAYGLFGNDGSTLARMVKEVDEQLEIQKVVHVSDKGMISANDKEEILANKGGYIFGTPLSKTDADAKAYIPDETGYKHPNASERMTVNERQIVFREENGYHVIHTNVIGSEGDPSSPLFRLEKPATALDIIDMYRGLWRIEERFLGSNQEKESIEAHLLSRFVSLLILKILELKTGKSIEFEKMVDDLRRLQVVEETDDVYLLLEPTNIIKAIGDAMDLDLVKVRYTARELKNLVAKTRKQGMVPDSARG